MATRQKAPRERRKVPIDLGPQISGGASLTSVQAFASQRLVQQTTTTAVLNAEASTISLNADPGVGAMLTVNPGDLVLEETFRVSAVSGTGPYVCDIIPSAEQQHGIGATVEYHQGYSNTVLVDTTPAFEVTGLVHLEMWAGADANLYDLTARGVCNNGEIKEDQVVIEVIEFLPTEVRSKQPGDITDIAFGFSDITGFFSTTLSSATAFIARERTTSTTVSGSHAVGAVSLSIGLSPGVGALLHVNPSQPNAEKLWVSAVGAGPPYPCTVSPLQFDHTNLEPVTVYPGVLSRLLTSPTATIVGGIDAILRVRQGASEQDYWMAVIGTLADGQIYQQTIRLSVLEVLGED